MQHTPQKIYLSEYKKPDFTIIECFLSFEIFDSITEVTNTMRLKRQSSATVLELDGIDLELVSLRLNGQVLNKEFYTVEEELLSISIDQNEFQLEVKTVLYPQKNTTLEGLYKSGEMFCTQNEPEGFRRITYFIDRPDVMALFTTKVTAPKDYPILLSNGNLIEKGEAADGRHFALWEDPFPKPTYLFALVAGDLGHISDSFQTSIGRNVTLNIYCDKGNELKCHHAMRSLKASMKWDEETYGREYDLDLYNIVAVDSFNMGAMENKGLNVFNSAYVLADEHVATDSDFLGIESVIAHEYFHNWTGNRITCRDWFQLTLKEGLTVFRDQCFSADMNSETVQRIMDVRALKERQFLEDSSPMAHPIKPESYIEINNFYTATVYEKGAEVIRMIYTLIGKDNFRKGMDIYFETFDGQAVRTEDFLWAMQKGGGLELGQFERWYSQERTPHLNVKSEYNTENNTFILECEQVVPKSVEEKPQEPFLYPLKLSLYNDEGKEIKLICDNQPYLDRHIVVIRNEKERFIFKEVTETPVCSLNQQFSAPIHLNYKQQDHAFLMRYDKDGFNRYQASQKFATETIFKLIAGKSVGSDYLEAYGALIDAKAVDPLLKSYLLELPTLSMLSQAQEVLDIEALFGAKRYLSGLLATTFKPQLLDLYNCYNEPTNSSISFDAMGNRALKNRVLSLIVSLKDSKDVSLVQAQFASNVTMTDKITALSLAENYYPDNAPAMLNAFYSKYCNNQLLMNKYFAIIASSQQPHCLERVEEKLHDSAFNIKVPNNVRGLIGSFARNLFQFHNKSGKGYAFIAQKIIELDAINPHVSAGLAGAFKQYPKLNTTMKSMMKTEMEKILSSQQLSKNAYEVVSKIVQE